MNRIPIVPVLLATGLTTLPGCKTLELASDWTRDRVEADGRSGEWLPVSPGWLDVDNLQVAARNDAERLYLMVRFRANDGQWARPCGMTGLTVWLSPSGKKARKTGFRLVAGPKPDSLARPAGAPFAEPGSNRERGPRPHDGMLVFLDRDADTSAVLTPDDADGVRAGFCADGGICSYEFSFPLTALPGQYGLGVGPGKAVMVGLTCGQDKEERAAQRERLQGENGGPPAGAGQRGGGPRGGGGGPGNGGRPGNVRGGSAPASPELWFKVRLDAVAGGPKGRQ